MILADSLVAAAALARRRRTTRRKHHSQPSGSSFLSGGGGGGAEQLGSVLRGTGDPRRRVSSRRKSRSRQAFFCGAGRCVPFECFRTMWKEPEHVSPPPLGIKTCKDQSYRPRAVSCRNHPAVFSRKLKPSFGAPCRLWMDSHTRQISNIRCRVFLVQIAASIFG